MLQPYSSVDPAPPHPAHANVDTGTLGDMLLQEDDYDIFDRYRVLFSLRNRGGREAVLQLCRALSRPTAQKDDTTALLRHEVAYVLGQLQHPSSIDALASSLADTKEHFMVRHESAEALGAIMEVDGECWGKVREILSRYLEDTNMVVRESCAVALDAAEYWAGDGRRDDSSAEPAESNPQHGFAILKATKEAHFNLQTPCSKKAEQV